MLLVSQYAAKQFIDKQPNDERQWLTNYQRFITNYFKSKEFANKLMLPVFLAPSS